MRLVRRLPVLLASSALLAGLSLAASGGASAQVGANQCANANAQPGTVPAALLADAARCLVNAERAAVGLNQLLPSSQLESVAANQASSSITSGVLSHTVGGNIVNRVSRTGFLRNYKKFSVGEILASGQTTVGTPAVVVGAWTQSPTHGRVIFFGRFKQLGVAVQSGAPGAPAATNAATYAIVPGFKKPRK